MVTQVDLLTKPTDSSMMILSLTSSQELSGTGSSVTNTTCSFSMQVPLSGNPESTESISAPTTPATSLSPSTECEDLIRFRALPEKAQEEFLDKHRDWNVDDSFDWWDSVYGDFVTQMQEIGIQVDTRTVGTHRGHRYEEPAIYFSGFWSQGDGACFEGRVDDWTTFFKALYPADHPKYQPLFTESEAGSPTLYWTHTGHYYHYNSCRFHDDFDINNEFDKDEQPLRNAVREALIVDLTALASTMFEDAENFIKDQMKKLYSNLEKEHDYLTSDEAILDSLVANDRLGELLDEYEAENSEE